MGLFNSIYDTLKPIFFSNEVLEIWQQNYLNLFTIVLVSVFSYLIFNVMWKIITLPFRR